MNKYNDTGIFKENTKLEQTQAINKQLKALYTAWFEHMENKGLKGISNLDKLNGMHLLTCFDPYICQKHKIMSYGKEANSQDGQIDVFDKDYQDDAYYTYDFAIVNPELTEKKDSYNRFYLKTRKIISGLKHNEAPSYDKILSILNNNLNKTSFMGKYTPCSRKKEYTGKDKELEVLYKLVNQTDKIVYSEFEYNGITKNIFIHELNILRPTHLVFLCGKGYNNHIKRDFGEKFYNKVNETINALNVKTKPVSKPVTLNKDEACEIFDIENYDVNLIFAIHPSAHMSADIRKKYEDKLTDFIKES